MRLFAFFLGLFLCAVPVGFAQEAVSDDGHVEETKDTNWIAVESTGTISGAKSGALEKTLWQGQKRSDIEGLLKNLSDRQSLRSVLYLQRRLLLTKADAGLIDNDSDLHPGNDLLIQRINKLMDMGLYDDAWDLYTEWADNPYDVSIAQLGMLLLIMRNELSTACLEEKVFASRYPADEFFNVLDNACAATIGSGKPSFPENPVLEKIYNDAAFGMSAAAPDALMKLTDLERALMLANGKIRYDGFTDAVAAKTPSTLLSLYLRDKNLPEAAKAIVARETGARNLNWHIAALARDPVWKRAKDLNKDKEDQWPAIESALKADSNPSLLYPYADMIADAEPTALSTETLKASLGTLLGAGKELSSYWVNAANRDSAENPVIYIYLQAFNALTATPEATVTPENLKKGLESLKAEDAAEIVTILACLDKESGNFNDLSATYDKEFPLTPDSNYVMPSESLMDLLKASADEKQIGITVMAVSNALAASPDRLYPETTRKSLEGLHSVGLIEDARTVGGEIIARILNKY